MIKYQIPADGEASDYYPPVDVIEPNPLSSGQAKITTLAEVIAHYTRSSLNTDGIQIVPESLKVYPDPSSREARYWVQFEAQPGYEEQGEHFAKMHQQLLREDCTGQAVNGARRMQETPGAWNPMSGYHTNKAELSRWHLFLPLGMPIANHRSVTLLHYPPYVAMQTADYLNNTTLWRWTRLLEHVGIKNEAERKLYWSIVDVNPIAAPGSGESEYPNDYFPIMMSSVFFDNEEWHCNYIRSVLEVMLNPPHNEHNPYTLPLLVGGSPLYDPQAPGWFRVRYKDQKLPDGQPALDRNEDYGEPEVKVTQAGFVLLNPESKKLTPYMIANHMIAAGVTGVCCKSKQDAAPDIRVYEAQDLVAASFLRQYNENPGIHPKEARAKACLDWFGDEKGGCRPKQSATNPDNLKIICALAQMDLYITYRPDKQPHVVPKYSFEQALERCREQGGADFDPCADGIGAKLTSCGPGGR